MQGRAAALLLFSLLASLALCDDTPLSFGVTMEGTVARGDMASYVVQISPNTTAVLFVRVLGVAACSSAPQGTLSVFVQQGTNPTTTDHVDAEITEDVGAVELLYDLGAHPGGSTAASWYIGVHLEDTATQTSCGFEIVAHLEEEPQTLQPGDRVDGVTTPDEYDFYVLDLSGLAPSSQGVILLEISNDPVKCAVQPSAYLRNGTALATELKNDFGPRDFQSSAPMGYQAFLRLAADLSGLPGGKMTLGIINRDAEACDYSVDLHLDEDVELGFEGTRINDVAIASGWNYYNFDLPDVGPLLLIGLETGNENCAFDLGVYVKIGGFPTKFDADFSSRDFPGTRSASYILIPGADQEPGSWYVGVFNEGAAPCEYTIFGHLEEERRILANDDEPDELAPLNYNFYDFQAPSTDRYELRLIAVDGFGLSMYFKRDAYPTLIDYEQKAAQTETDGDVALVVSLSAEENAYFSAFNANGTHTASFITLIEVFSDGGDGGKGKNDDDDDDDDDEAGSVAFWVIMSLCIAVVVLAAFGAAYVWVRKRHGKKFETLIGSLPGFSSNRRRGVSVNTDSTLDQSLLQAEHKEGEEEL